MQTEDTQKQLGLFHKLGHTLLQQGRNFIKNAYKLSPKIFTRTEVLTFLNQETGIPINSISLADEKFYVETLDKWGQIIDYDLIDSQEYYSDWRDCDNFALLYTSQASFIYGLNSCPTAFGDIYDAKTGAYLFRHAFNIIITHQDGVLKLKIYEPQTDESMEWVKGKGSISERLGWRYTCDWILAF